MKNLKLISAVVLSSTLLLGTVGCSSSGNGSGNGGSTPTATDTKKQDPKPAAEQPKDTEKPKTDLAGRTIHISAWWDGSPKPDTDSGKAAVDKLAAVEKKYNIKIVYDNVPFDQYQQKFTTTVLAGQPFADVVRLQYDWALAAAVKGQLLKVNELLKIDNAKALVRAYPLKGEDYGLDVKGGTNDGGIYYNRDLVKKLGLTDPQDLVAQNKWVWDEFEKLAKQATQDTNNDGKPDTWGWAGWNAEAAQFFVASNGGMISDDKAGKEMISDPKTIEALDFENKLYNVDHVVKVKKNDVDLWEERDTFGDGDVAMTYGWAWQAEGLAKKNINYGYVPFPIGPKGKDFINPVTGGGNTWFIPKGVKDPQIVAQILDEIYDVPTKESYPGQDWLEKNYKSDKDIQLIRNMAGKIAFMNYTAYPDYPFNTFVSDVIKNKVPAATAAEKVKQQAQASIDKILKAQ